MGRYIIKLTHKKVDYYLEWSTVVDAPVTYGMSLENFKKYYLVEYGKSMFESLDERLFRVEKFGISAHLEDLKSLFECNRAGDNDECLTKQQIIEKYCL